MKNKNVDHNDIKRTIVNQEERNSCPECGSIRIIKKGYYICGRCGWKGDNPKKIIWYFGMPYRGGGPPAGKVGMPTARDRHSCPDCHSVRVRKRIYTRDFFCDNCGWIGNTPTTTKWGVVNL